MHVLPSDHPTQQFSKLKSDPTVGFFTKVQSVLVENQLGQNYSTGVKWAVQGHETRINYLPQ